MSSASLASGIGRLRDPSDQSTSTDRPHTDDMLRMSIMHDEGAAPKYDNNNHTFYILEYIKSTYM